jgi:hypothetical protein
MRGAWGFGASLGALGNQGLELVNIRLAALRP